MFTSVFCSRKKSTTTYNSNADEMYECLVCLPVKLVDVGSQRLKLWNASPRPGKNVAVQLLADGLHVEADLLQFFVRENLATVEDVGRLHHRLVNALVVEILEGNVLLYVRERQRRQV